MKQHITQEQWNELNDKQKEKFLGRPIEYYGSENYKVVANFGLFEVSIGKMIQFLDLDLRMIIYIDYEGWGMQWRGGGELVIKEDLCDALWEAVKEKIRS